MKSEEIRRTFLDFFEKKGHRICKSDYLVPPSDPTLLFTTAGMVQFKPLWAGAKLEFTRAASIQKCLRAGGKGSDLENVGKTLRHHTFFEMLGNFSFGDYFKKEAIEWAWEFVVNVLKMDGNKIYVTIYKDDDEAYEIWNKNVGIPSERIVRLGDKDNFWGPAGDEGACGPCSELLYDLGEEKSCGKPNCAPGCDCERYLEFWNLVFPQYYQRKDGTRVPLERRGIDTGMGLERLAFLLQKDAKSNYETDLFLPIVKEIENIMEKHKTEENKQYFHIIADHIRALTFAISENILPSNEGRGYVLRRILRRAYRAGLKLGIDKPFLYRLVPVVGEIMKERYPELLESKEIVSKVILSEEERFNTTLQNAFAILEEEINKSREGILDGKTIFKLYDTYGMPIDIIKEEAEERGIRLDEVGFKTELENQKEKGKKSWKKTSVKVSDIYADIAQKYGKTIFTGYEEEKGISTVIGLIKDGKSVSRAESGNEVEIIVKETPFYAESGGQISDTGIIRNEKFRAKVKDTQKDINGIFIHYVVIENGSLSLGDEVILEPSLDRRFEISKHHTATHLLHYALRKHLGSHVKQSGSFVGDNRLRFDFSHFESIDDEELEKIEREVNELIFNRIDVQFYNKKYDEAIKEGVIAIFGEKYGDIVRVVDIGGISRELCGGIHVKNTIEIGGFKITKTSSVSAGIRRIEAVCGRSFYNLFAKRDKILQNVSRLLKSSDKDIFYKIENLIIKVKELEKELEKTTSISNKGNLKIEKKEKIREIDLIVREYEDIKPQMLRNISDELKSRFQNGVFVLILNMKEGKSSLIVSSSKKLTEKGIDCGKIIKEILLDFGGKGGGRKDMAQGGSSRAIETEKVFLRIKKIVESLC